jgi:hypothetical protein
VTCRLCLAVVGLLFAASARADDPPNPSNQDEAKPPADQPASPARGESRTSETTSPDDADLLRSLEKQLMPDLDEEHPLLRVGERMRDVQGRLTKADAGTETREMQKTIVQDLDKLIEQMKKGST